MVKVEVLTTPGCAACAKVKQMLDGLKVKYRILDITKHQELVAFYQLMSAPGIVIDGKLRFSGVPSMSALKAALGK